MSATTPQALPPVIRAPVADFKRYDSATYVKPPGDFADEVRRSLPSRRREFDPKFSASHLSGAVRASFFLCHLYELSTQMEETRAIDEIFDFIDDNLIDGKFDQVNDVFLGANPKKMLPSLVHSILMVSHAAKNQLPAREQFFRAAVLAIADTHDAGEASDLARYE